MLESRKEIKGGKEGWERGTPFHLTCFLVSGFLFVVSASSYSLGPPPWPTLLGMHCPLWSDLGWNLVLNSGYL